MLQWCVHKMGWSPAIIPEGRAAEFTQILSHCARFVPFKTNLKKKQVKNIRLNLKEKCTNYRLFYKVRDMHARKYWHERYVSCQLDDLVTVQQNGCFDRKNDSTRSLPQNPKQSREMPWVMLSFQSLDLQEEVVLQAQNRNANLLILSVQSSCKAFIYLWRWCAHGDRKGYLETSYITEGEIKDVLRGSWVRFFDAPESSQLLKRAQQCLVLYSRMEK